MLIGIKFVSSETRKQVYVPIQRGGKDLTSSEPVIQVANNVSKQRAPVSDPLSPVEASTSLFLEGVGPSSEPIIPVENGSFLTTTAESPCCADRAAMQFAQSVIEEAVIDELDAIAQRVMDNPSDQPALNITIRDDGGALTPSSNGMANGVPINWFEESEKAAEEEFIVVLSKSQQKKARQATLNENREAYLRRSKEICK